MLPANERFTKLVFIETPLRAFFRASVWQKPMDRSLFRCSVRNAIGFFIARHNKGQIVGFNKAR
jgi:hypothetical protein